MKHLKLWQQWGLIALGSFALLAGALSAALSSVPASRSADIRREIQGLDFLTAVTSLLRQVQFSSNPSATGESAELINTVDFEKAIHAVDEIAERLPPNLRITPLWSPLRAECQQLIKRSTGTVSSDEATARRLQLRESLASCLRRIVDSSGLTVDPQLETQHLIETTGRIIPNLGNGLAQGRDIVLGLTPERPIPISTALRLALVASRLNLLSDAARVSMDFVSAGNPAWKGILEAARSANSAALHEALHRAQELSAGRAATGVTLDDRVVFTRSLESVHQLSSQCSSAIHALLEARLRQARADWTATLLWIFAGFTAVGGLIAFYLQRFNGSLTELRRTLDAAQRGEFAHRFPGNRHDELGDLGNGLNHLLDRINALSHQWKSSGERIQSSVTEITGATREQMGAGEQVSTATSQIGATSKQIATTSQDLARTVTEVAGIVEETAALATDSQAGLLRMQSTMDRVTLGTTAITEKLSTMSAKANRINRVITTITQVADQTNLLSLNAAIEAEKAGEFGRGFAVVATEIRRLAIQAAVATVDIGQMVKEMHAAVGAGVSGMATFSEEVCHGVAEVEQISFQLKDVIERVQALMPRFERVQQGMQNQVTGASQISDGLALLSHSVGLTANSAGRANAALEQLSRVTQELDFGFASFKSQP